MSPSPLHARFGPLAAWLLVGLLSTLAAVGLGRTGLVEAVEGRSFDWRIRHLPRHLPPAGAALVLIDERSLSDLGRLHGIRWPFPRDLYCPVLGFLRHAGARAVAFDVQFSEPDEFDGIFAECIRQSGQVWLAWHCQGAPPGPGEASPELPLLPAHGQAPPTLEPPCRPVLPVEPLRSAARGLGRIDMEPDPDGVVRRATLLRPERTAAGTAGVAPVLGVAPLVGDKPRTIVAFQPGSVRIANHDLPLDAAGRMLPWWRPPDAPLTSASFSAVWAAGGRLEAGEPAGLPTAPFRDKVVFVGGSAAGTYDLRVTPSREADIGVNIHVSLFESARTGQAIRRATGWLDALLVLVLCLGVAAATLRLRKVRWQLVLSAALVGAHLAVAALAYHQGVWLGVVAPWLGMAVAFASGTAVNYRTEGRERRRIRHAFQHYLAPAVIEQLVSDPKRLELGGEWREITAFFSDIAGFTSVSERLDPRTLIALLNECLSAVSESILDEGGTIDKYVGDAVIAMFGAPLDQPDHAARACRAALRSQQRLAELRASWRERGLPELQIRVGLNSGVALVGNMGSRHRFDYTMMGDMVNLASRLEGANAPYGTAILAGERTAELAGEVILAREIDCVRVKGRGQPVRVFEPVAVRGAATALQFSLVQDFGAALATYRDHRWDDAQAAFAALSTQHPDDRASRVFQCRAAQFAVEPPPADWDRVHELISK